MSPNLAPVSFETQNETAIMGDTPRSALVLSVRPSANMHNPARYTSTRVIVLFLSTILPHHSSSLYTSIIHQKGSLRC